MPLSMHFENKFQRKALKQTKHFIKKNHLKYQKQIGMFCAENKTDETLIIYVCLIRKVLCLKFDLQMMGLHLFVENSIQLVIMNLNII